MSVSLSATRIPRPIRTIARVMAAGLRRDEPALRRVAFVAAMAVGAVLLLASSAIHANLWSETYRNIPTIGPLFLAQSITGALLALGVVFYRRVGTLLAGIGYLAMSVGGLLLSAGAGLFGFKNGLSAPMAKLSLVIEVAGIAVFALAALVLAVSWAGASLRNLSAASA